MIGTVAVSLLVGLWLYVWVAMTKLERIMIPVVIVLACLVMFSILLIGPSHGVVECNISPAQDGARWMWREIDGRRCWFRAPKQNSDPPKLRWKVK